MSLPLTPSFTGFIGSTKDAVLVIQAVLAGDFPSVDHRPLDKERADLIKSGNVFVFIEETSGIKRWTDGISWSASRILGRFLVYRELDPASVNEKDDRRKRRKHLELLPSLRHNSAHEVYSAPQDPPLMVSDYHRPAQIDVYRSPHDALGGKTRFGAQQDMSSYGQARQMFGNSPQYGGIVSRGQPPQQVSEDRSLIKKTLSVTTGPKDNQTPSKNAKQTIHLISYYSAHDVLSGKLTRPSHGSLKNMTVPSLLWEAVKRSTLGGKIPIEDEAYYYLDSNYQLQNMSVLLTTGGEHVKRSPMRSTLAIHGQALSKSLTSPVSNKLPYVLPVPFSGPAPPVTFHSDYVPQLLQQHSSKHIGLLTSDSKKDDELSEYGSNSFLNNSLSGYNVPSKYGYGHHFQPDQRMAEYLLQQPYGPTSQVSHSGQHQLYDQQQYHQPQHHPSQSFGGPPPNSQDHQYVGGQEGIYVSSYAGQYPIMPYQMYNNGTYYNSGGGQPVISTSSGLTGTSLGPGHLQHLQQHQHPQQNQPGHLMSADQQAQNLHQHLQLQVDYSAQRGGNFVGAGGIQQTSASGHGHVPTSSKGSTVYPDYYAPVEEPYNYN